MSDATKPPVTITAEDRALLDALHRATCAHLDDDQGRCGQPRDGDRPFCVRHSPSPRAAAAAAADRAEFKQRCTQAHQRLEYLLTRLQRERFRANSNDFQAIDRRIRETQEILDGPLEVLAQHAELAVLRPGGSL